jgi:hypothetical protein
MGSNNITNVGTVDGVTVSSHATRHQFGGLDPVGSTTPSPNAIPYADVSGTLDSWVSTATTTTMGKVRLSVSPVSASNPVAVGTNDNRINKAITGGTFNNSTDTLSLTTNDGSTVTIAGFTDYYVTGGTYSGGTLTLNRNGLSSIIVTGFTSSSSGGLQTKANSVNGSSFTGNPKKYTVTFGTPFTDANYSISITAGVTRSFTYESKTSSGFIINSNSNTSFTETVDWVCIKHGES